MKDLGARTNRELIKLMIECGTNGDEEGIHEVTKELLGRDSFESGFRRERVEDPQKYRVTLNRREGGGAYGYGATIEEARENAKRYYKGAWGEPFKLGKDTEEVIEKVTDDGTHYEEHNDA